MGDELPNPVKKKLAELVTAAHETALRRELAKLDEHFERWRRSEIDSFDLSERIHQFHEGPAREIYKEFTYTRSADLPMLAARAIQSGVLPKHAVPDDVVPYLERLLAFYREL